MNKEAAFQAWADGFGIPAYAENAVPEDAEEPYMTYYLPTAMFGDGEQAATLSLWYRTTSEAEPRIPRPRNRQGARCVAALLPPATRGFYGSSAERRSARPWIRATTP